MAWGELKDEWDRPVKAEPRQVRTYWIAVFWLSYFALVGIGFAWLMGWLS